jgi:propanediol dehydratase small subunit
MSALEKLTEGIIARDLGQEGAALINKWDKTGLLEGLDCDVTKNNMARLLENQAKELLREASSMQAGDVQGFSAVAFPIVRRVFGELIANELVSVQPMSLPSGLIFFLDFTANISKPGYAASSSLFGGAAVANQLTGGMNIDGSTGNSEAGPYALNNGYASPTGTFDPGSVTSIASGTYNRGNQDSSVNLSAVTPAAFDRLLQYDMDIASGTTVAIASVARATLDAFQIDMNNLITLEPGSGAAGGGFGGLQRRLTRIDPSDNTRVLLVNVATASESANQLSEELSSLDAAAGISVAIKDNWTSTGVSIGTVAGTTVWGLETLNNIPEIDIKVDSVAVTANTKKLKAKWSPELGQDLNAYHNLDAEVELTSILSEQIALEIDQEILEDLIQGANKSGAVRYWSRKAGKFVNRSTGVEVGVGTTPDFTGTVSEWYETLVETVNDVSAQIHRKTVRGGANFIVCGPEVAGILEFTAGFRANVAVDSNKGTAGAMNVGSLSKKWDIYVDPYFPRNVVLVGRKGNSFLESGYVYAPYVPLQVTPTIFGTEDFVPRKGVMTRYAKQMVRPDMYGLVIIEDLV